MNFGSLQIVTAWRLTRGAAACQALVIDGQEGFRFVVIEDQQIVSWERVATIQDLRKRVADTLNRRRVSGWSSTSAVRIAGATERSNVTQPRNVARGLFTIG